MDSKNAAYYMLFHDHTEGLASFDCAKRAGANVRVAPAPHGAAACCGMSLMVAEESIGVVRALVESGACTCEKIVRLENRMNPRRDRYC